MSNPQATPTVTETVKTTPALVKSVRAICDAQALVEGKFQAGADACRLAAKELGYDRSKASAMLKQAYAEAGQDIVRKAPDISKILSLAYPATEESAQALADAKAHNATAPAAEKIGVNDQLRIARDKEGKTTVASILAERAEKSTRGAQNGGAPRIPGTSASPSPTVFNVEDEKKALMHTITRLRTVGKLSEEQVDTIIAEIVTEFNESVKS